MSARFMRVFLWCVLLLVTPGICCACPFCAAPSLTLGERVVAADAVVLAEPVRSRRITGRAEVVKVLVVREVYKGREPLIPGHRLTFPRLADETAGTHFLCIASSGRRGLDWSEPLSVTEAGWRYITQAPSRTADDAERLKYFVRFLEAADPLIAEDAYGEFANSPYEAIVAMRSDLPRDSLRKWVTNPRTPGSRLGLYGMLLGLCGDAADARRLEQVILQGRSEVDGFRPGIDGVMGGYLLLTRERGLDFLERKHLTDPSASFADIYAAMQALRFCWKYAGADFNRDRLRHSMRTLLIRPELADLVIADLARWQDWSVQSRLLAMYEEDAFQTPAVKRAIVRFMLVSIKAGEAGASRQIEAQIEKQADRVQPAHAVQARRILDELRLRDPRTVSDAERFFSVR